MFSIFFRPISDKWQVLEVTQRGLKPNSNIFRTCTVLSLPPDTGTIQSQVLLSIDLYRFRILKNSSSLFFQSINFLFLNASQAEQSPSASNFRSGLVEGSKQFVQY
jgi:hypothetical protein